MNNTKDTNDNTSDNEIFSSKELFFSKCNDCLKNLVAVSKKIGVILGKNLKVFTKDLRVQCLNVFRYVAVEYSPTFKSQTIFVIDCIVAFFSILISALVFEDVFFEYSSGFLIKNMIVFFMVTIASFLLLGTHKYSSNFVIRKDLAPLFLTIVVSTVLYYPFMGLIGQLENFSVTTLFANIFVCITLMCFFRSLSKINKSFLYPFIKNTLSIVKTSFISSKRIFLYRISKYTKNYSSERKIVAFSDEGNINIKEESERIAPLLSTSKINVAKAVFIGDYQEVCSFFDSETSQYYSIFEPVFAITLEAIDEGKEIKRKKNSSIFVRGNLEALYRVLDDPSTIIPFDYIFIVGSIIPDNVVFDISKVSAAAKIPVLQINRLNPYLSNKTIRVEI